MLNSRFLNTYPLKPVQETRLATDSVLGRTSDVIKGKIKCLAMHLISKLSINCNRNCLISAEN